MDTLNEYMDALDDFTVLNIIGWCDLRTVFGALPLVCRRIHALHDDVSVVRRFRDELRARITAPAARENIICGYFGRLQAARTPVRLPLKLVTKANLGYYKLAINIYVRSTDSTDMRGRHVFTPEIQSSFTRFSYAYIANCSMLCKLTTTFGTICAAIDTRIINNMMAPAMSVVYQLRTYEGGAQFIVCERATCSDQTMYSLGFGCEYTIMDIVIRVDANRYEYILDSNIEDDWNNV